jgi:hypothetical protein
MITGGLYRYLESWFCDKAFTLDGQIEKPNVQFWTLENLRLFVIYSLHPDRDLR